jgi:hypothetical protein
MKKTNNNKKITKKQFSKFKNNKNKKDNIQNKRISNLEKALKGFSRRINFVLPRQPRYDYSYLQQQIKNYIAGLLFPEKFIDCGIKLPSPIGSYSFCYGFKEAVDITPGEDGTFRIIWNPNCLGCNTINMGSTQIKGGPELLIQTQEGNRARLYNYPSRIIWSNSRKNNKLLYHTTPSQTFSGSAEGYRLVSASLFIEYIGTNLKKSGYIISIPTYRPISTYSMPSTANTDMSFVDGTIPEIDESNFLNTKGSLTSFILRPNSKCKRVYLPSDPADCIYEDMGYYYSSAVSSSQSYREATEQQLIEDGAIVVTDDQVQLRRLQSEDGNPLKYIFYGKGFQTDNQCIHISAYYNFELLPSEGVRLPNNETHEEEKLSETIKTVIVEKARDFINNSISEQHQMPNNNDVKKVAEKVFSLVQPTAQDKEWDSWTPSSNYKTINLRSFGKPSIAEIFSNYMKNYKSDLRI